MKKFVSIVLLLVCFLLMVSSLSSCDFETGKGKTEYTTRSKTISYSFFNTVSVMSSYGDTTEEEFSANCEAVYEVLDEYHKLFDIYYEYSGVNNLKTVNKNAGKEPVEVDRKLIDFLLYAKEIYTLTDGATNIAMGAVLKLWHVAREVGVDDPENAYVPSAEELDNAAKHTDIDKVIIDEEKGTVYLTDPEMSLDVGAIGKGYATERAAELLIERGANSYVLNIGGNIRAIGKKITGEGWVTGITNPDKTSDKRFACRVVFEGGSLVTSGNYERYYLVDGKPYHHIIDSKTNMPAEYFSSVSIFAEDSGLADALSTALFCMNYEDGLEMIRNIGGVDVIWIGTDGEIKTTDGINFYTE